jgi:retron-type reverse transcriptase
VDRQGQGKKRPIGVAEIEGKIVQKAVSMPMGAVFQQDFLPISYGFRDGRNAHDALAHLREQCMTHGIRWIYDADITGFFDNLDWGWLREFIQRRINDGGILRLIGKWLNARNHGRRRHQLQRQRNARRGVIKRKTARKKVRKTIQGIREWCRRNRHRNVEEQYRVLYSKLRGHYQYFGVRGNSRAMAVVQERIRRAWCYWLHRRGGKHAQPRAAYTC